LGQNFITSIPDVAQWRANVPDFVRCLFAVGSASLLANRASMNENGTVAIGPASKRPEYRPGKIGLALHFGKWKPMDREDNEPKLFSLSEAEQARRQVEPLLIVAMERHRQVAEFDDKLSAIANRILMMGGITIDYEATARLRFQYNRLITQVKGALDQIHATGCVVKDLNSGLVDFPAVLKNEEVYLCWRLGEDRIRFYHRQDEGFSGRKPIDPKDTGPYHPIQ
jgi:hypothetical protein